MERKKVISVIPAYNEEESLPETLKELSELRPDIDIIVINDGSTDHTEDVLKSFGCRYVTLPANLGIGGAVQTGLRYAYRNGYDVAFQYDADGQHRPDQIAGLVEPILEGNADMVLGSRFLKNTGYSVSRGRAGMMWLLKVLCSKATGVRVTDSTSGFRAYGRKAIGFMIENCSTDYPEIEAIILLARNGYRYVETPATMGQRVAGESMFNPLRASYFMVRAFLGIMTSVLATKRQGCAK